MISKTYSTTLTTVSTFWFLFIALDLTLFTRITATANLANKGQQSVSIQNHQLTGISFSLHDSDLYPPAKDLSPLLFDDVYLPLWKIQRRPKTLIPSSLCQLSTDSDLKNQSHCLALRILVDLTSAIDMRMVDELLEMTTSIY